MKYSSGSVSKTSPAFISRTRMAPSGTTAPQSTFLSATGIQSLRKVCACSVKVASMAGSLWMAGKCRISPRIKPFFEHSLPDKTFLTRINPRPPHPLPHPLQLQRVPLRALKKSPHAPLPLDLPQTPWLFPATSRTRLPTCKFIPDHGPSAGNACSCACS